MSQSWLCFLISREESQVNFGSDSDCLGRNSSCLRLDFWWWQRQLITNMPSNRHQWKDKRREEKQDYVVQFFVQRRLSTVSQPWKL